MAKLVILDRLSVFRFCKKDDFGFFASLVGCFEHLTHEMYFT